MDLPAAIEKYWGQLLGMAAAAAWSVDRVLTQRNKDRDVAIAASAAKAVAKLDLERLTKETVADVIKTLREEVDHWTGEVENPSSKGVERPSPLWGRITPNARHTARATTKPRRP